MKLKPFAVDLHIHSCLSPCGDVDMTPNNIVNMAVLKGLDVIAVADHNSAKNLPAVQKVAKAAGIGLLPAIEVNTKEEIHALAYFDKVEKAMQLDEIIYASLPEIVNDEKYFGAQNILDQDDEIIGNVRKLLISAADISISDLQKICTEIGGVVVPAHLDRKSFSLVSNLGFIPHDMDIKYVELSRRYKLGENLLLDKMIQKYKTIRSSDAHYLHDIFEREFFMHLDEPSASCIIEKLRV
ncbi:PHP domain-containing protein [Alkalibacter mobilis]|uniref:PHP domain-containing protein n=1 Tax=Alkalibacter mobilis TaxID=2787712 RepID=UPI00189CB877|nr:PHP domain-containing protein [Alkalibacter mobilis]MBF7097830.1 PHP domain-containing protein [Alkalibacter mobilis]